MWKSEFHLQPEAGKAKSKAQGLNLRIAHTVPEMFGFSILACLLHQDQGPRRKRTHRGGVGILGLILSAVSKFFSIMCATEVAHTSLLKASTPLLLIHDTETSVLEKQQTLSNPQSTISGSFSYTFG